MNQPISESHTQLIGKTIEQLRDCSIVDIQSRWLQPELSNQDITDVIASNWSDWKVVPLNSKQHVAWQRGKKVLWLVQRVLVPQDLHGYPVSGLSLRLALVWWADVAEIYVNGELVLEGDLFDCSPRVLLSQEVNPSEEFIVALRLVSPGHDHGALVRSQIIYESTNSDHNPDPGFVADELAVLQIFLARLAPEKLVTLGSILPEINQETKDWSALLLNLRVALRQLWESIGAEKSKIYLLGHAHLDLAWLWPVDETWRAAQNTFASVLQLQREFPDFIFCHSTPALYAWVEQHRPDLFAAIQKAVVSGCWEVVGGLWVEPELNLISGESIVRQLLYGQLYTREKFGQIATVAWLPDTFGFCATLPQFLVNAGVKYFVTQKLRWNDTTKFDYGAFWWRSPDGSQILSLMSSLIGEGIDPIKMASYLCEWQEQTGLPDALWLPGVGDHGGGPTRDMLEIAQRWQKSPVFPELEFTTSAKYLEEIASHNQLPIWSDELYLEFHRGCYTTHADQKQWNRRCEDLLYQAELFASIATILYGKTYPQTEITSAWQQVLFQQFHDILPGSAITQVYQDALPQWQHVQQIGDNILQESLLTLASQVVLPHPPHPEAQPIFIFNPLNWERSDVVSISLPSTHREWQIYDISGNLINSQLGTSLLFLAAEIPPVGYRVFWLAPALHVTTDSTPNHWILENEFLQVTVNPHTGDLASVIDKKQQRQVLGGDGNQLQAFQDDGQYWDAWNIDPNYAQHPLPPTTLKSIEWVETGSIEHRLRVVRQLGKSEFAQDYILQAGSPLLKITSTVNWQENHVLVKAAFPLNVTADFTTYEIPCGAVRRPTQDAQQKGRTPAENAKWEVPALRWADLTEVTSKDIYGVSILNDCKYGYDSHPAQIRLTLLRSSQWPDAEADRGIHQFTYALYPHCGSWQTAHTVRRGYELNLPLQVIINPPTKQDAPSVGAPPISFLDLGADNLILMALKPAADHPQQFIIRFYECHGETAQLDWRTGLSVNLGDAVDLLERPCKSSKSLTVQPWKINSFQLLPGASTPEQDCSQLR